MSPSSWREFVETIGIDMREEVEKVEGQICLPHKKLTIIKSGDLGGEKSPRILFVFILAGSACKTLGHDHTAINK